VARVVLEIDFVTRDSLVERSEDRFVVREALLSRGGPIDRFPDH
jgi:hypothetical protein